MAKSAFRFIPLVGVGLVAISGVGMAFAQGGGGPGGGEPAKCDGYCSDEVAPVCGLYQMKCCCDNAGVWECVCKSPTDCNSSNGCQDPGE